MGTNGTTKSPPCELVFTDYSQASSLTGLAPNLYAESSNWSLIIGVKDSLVPTKYINNVCMPDY